MLGYISAAVAGTTRLLSYEVVLDLATAVASPADVAAEINAFVARDARAGRDTTQWVETADAIERWDVLSAHERWGKVFVVLRNDEGTKFGLDLMTFAQMVENA